MILQLFINGHLVAKQYVVIEPVYKPQSFKQRVERRQEAVRQTSLAMQAVHYDKLQGSKWEIILTIKEKYVIPNKHVKISRLIPDPPKPAIDRAAFTKYSNKQFVA